MSLLEQIRPSLDGKFLSTLQNQVDGLVEGFISQATDWKSLSAMMAGGMSYRLGKIGMMSTRAGILCDVPLRFASIAVGLGAEVTAFEMTHRSLSDLTGEGIQNRNLWKWEGRGGLKEGCLSSLVTFGALKGFGKMTQGQNLILQHGAQDLGMVLGHQVAYEIGVGPTPEGTLAEQLLHAEATNLQVSAGAALGHGVMAGRLYAAERGLDLAFAADRSQRASALEDLLGKVFVPSETVPVFSAAQDVNVETFLDRKRPEDGLQWMNIYVEHGLLIAAGILGATAARSWLARTLRLPHAKPEFFYIPSEEERGLLKPFFPTDVPRRFRLADWEKINQQLYDEACDATLGRDKKLYLKIKNQALYDLYLRIVDAKLEYLRPPPQKRQKTPEKSHLVKIKIDPYPRPHLNFGTGMREIPANSEGRRARSEQVTLLAPKSDASSEKKDSSDEKDKP